MTGYVCQDRLTQKDLLSYFEDGYCPPERWSIGTESEKLGVDSKTLRAIPYFGEKGVETILRKLCEIQPWEPVYENNHIISLKQDGYAITLEPGGQIELSGRLCSCLDCNVQEIEDHIATLLTLTEPLGIYWLGLGLQPLSPASEIEWVPKTRYQIMSQYFSKCGQLAHAMMKQTASVQVSIDYASEADAMEKLRVVMGIAPLLTAIFANSPIYGGQESGYLSKRAHIWTLTDPDRCGLIENVLRDDTTFRDYITYALRVPMLFIVRDGKWIPLSGRLTFAQFLAEGYSNYQPTPADWELHLSTIFTEARLKKVIEIRSIDHQKKALSFAIPAFLKGLLYDKESRRAAWRLVRNWSFSERQELQQQASKYGLRAEIRKQKLIDLARELYTYSLEGLKRLASASLTPPGSVSREPVSPISTEIPVCPRHCSTVKYKYLGPLEELLFKKSSCPARILLENWNGRWNKDLRKLVEYVHLA